MGQCYCTSLRYKIREGVDEPVKKVIADFSKNFKDCPYSNDTLQGFILNVFGPWGDSHNSTSTDKDGWTTVDTHFDGSYSWELTMEEAFRRIAPFLQDGSSFYLEPDLDWYQYEVQDGKAVLTDSGNLEDDEEPEAEPAD